MIVTPGTTFSKEVTDNNMGIACECNATSIAKAILHAVDEQDALKQCRKMQLNS